MRLNRLTTVALLFSVAALHGCGTALECADGTEHKGDSCVPLALETCPDGMVRNGDSCVAVPQECGAGAQLQGNICVPLATTCGAGTHAEGAVCVPDGPPPADVVESVDEMLPSAFTGPLAGEIRTLGGVVDTPTDIDGDGYIDADWDDFVFAAPAGTWLSITATSQADAHPGLVIASEAVDDNGRPLYVRWVFDPNAVAAQRQLYLPFDGNYAIWVTDLANLWPIIFNWPAMPVGGPNFTYQVTLENLGQPMPTAVSSLPFVDPGSFADGRLGFYSVDGALADTAVFVASSGKPLPTTISEIYPAVTVFNETGAMVRETTAIGIEDGADVLLTTVDDRSYMVVHDFTMLIGTGRDYHFSIKEEVPLDCRSTDCNLTDVTDDHALLAWDLVPGDLVAAGVYVPQGLSGQVGSVLMGPDLTLLDAPQMASQYRGGPHAHFAAADERVMLWVQRLKGSAGAAQFSLEQRVVETPALTPGSAMTGLSVEALPADVLEASGFSHLQANAGELIVSAGVSTTSGAWSAPVEALWNSALDAIGPATDATDPSTLWNSRMSSVVALVPADDLYLHVLQDADGADVAGATYDVTLQRHTPLLLGLPAEGTPTVLPAEVVDASSGAQVYALSLDAWQGLDLRVSPAAGSSLQPEIWVLVPGELAVSYTSYWWQTGPDAERLGLMAQTAATAVEQDAVLPFAAAQDGLTAYVVVRDAQGRVLPGASFDLTLTRRQVPQNDLCAAAQPIDLSSGSASLTVNSIGATDSVSLPSGNGCTSRPTGGPDLFFAVDLAEGDTLDVSADASAVHNAVLTLYDDCAQPESCVAFGSGSSNPESLSWQVPAGAAGRYILSLDGLTPTSMGDVTLTVTRN